ncbi:hypothetical protein PVAP13_6NG370400 [Panicum virgatum]|uniref:Uncharacterized protein n=1 Tax=Panicum virgatum TaxID=38727 RepID=A0A8T0R6D1_PANVG|nr:hypothetical protein PVAP13_6NG370400 [Panicum virgatum]
MAFHRLDNKVVATDPTGGAVLYDPDKQAVRPLPSHDYWLKNNVLSHTVGNTLYVMDRLTNGTGTRAFEALVHTPSLHGTWHWRTLPPLPPPPPPGVEDAADDPTGIASFVAADDEGSKIWVSATGSGDVKGCTPPVRRGETGVEQGGACGLGAAVPRLRPVRSRAQQAVVRHLVQGAWLPRTSLAPPRPSRLRCTQPWPWRTQQPERRMGLTS